MTRVFYASTLFGAIGLVAAIDAGLFGERAERRILIVSNNTSVPEISESFVDSSAFVTLQQRFDEVVRWNEIIAPMHPSGWVPRAAEVPLISRLLIEHLGIEDAVTELVLESVAVSPSRAIGMLIADCPITVYSDGLMSYGPTRDELPVEVGRRTTRLLYLDLLPGIDPLLLGENEVSIEVIPASSFAKVVAELPEPPVDSSIGAPVILGQYLSRLGVVSAREETDLHSRMLRAVVAAGHRHVVFKPHPAAGSDHVHAMEQEAVRLGVSVHVSADPLPAEAWFAAARPEIVVSCFSTALLTASRLFELPVATMGCDLVLRRLTPYENSNRIPVTIVDATVPELREDGTLHAPPVRDIGQLLNAVGYCMQASRRADLRADAETYLEHNGRERYFKNRRLESLGLVQPPASLRAGARRVARRIARRTYHASLRHLETWRRRRAAADAETALRS